MHRRRDCCASPDDGPADQSMNRNVDTATHLVRGLGVEENRILQDLASLEVCLGEV